jgi:hypothetical protein
MQASRSSRSLVLVLAALVAAGCMGKVGDGVGQNGDPICLAPDPGPSPIRRMTRVEYNNTIRDLLGDETRPADTFAPEEEALGFNNNAYALGVTQLLAEQYMVASEEISERATGDMAALLPCDPAGNEDACAAEFIAWFGQRAFRRPLAADEQGAFVALYTWGRTEYDFATGIQLVIQKALQSPHFLYRVEFGGTPLAEDERVAPLTSWEMASRLSFFLWGSMPDDELFAAAEADALSTPEEIEAQARRMLDDPRAHATVAEFHAQWLQLGRVATLEKDPAIFPTWEPALGPLFLQETHAFLDDVFWSGDLDALFTSSHSYMNGQLAAYYGVTGPAGADFERVELDPTQRAGFLTHASILAANAKHNQTSPVHRGKFVREQLLCQMLPPPPDDIEIVPPDLDPDLTTRERFREHSENAYCAGCHRLMDPIGFGFEKYDGAGLWRNEENGMPIDDTGEIVASEDLDGEFAGVTDLGQKLAGSDEVRGCVTRQWFRFAYGRGETTRDLCTIASLGAAFEESGYSMKELLVALTGTDAFRYRTVGGAP